MKTTSLSVLTLLLAAAVSCSRGPEGDIIDYVDPMIGAGGSGGVFVGACVPFGMVKPGPDAACPYRNSGWAETDIPLAGFAQTHVSGTGGSPRYGNILVMPFTDGFRCAEHCALRSGESARAGLYSTSLDNGIDVSITASHSVSCYTFTFPEGVEPGLEIDAGYCRTGRGKGQSVTDAGIKCLSPTEFEGWSTVKGGWGAGWKPYTVYFYAVTDVPAEVRASLVSTGTPVNNPDTLSRGVNQLNLRLDAPTRQVRLKVGISFLSCRKARENVGAEVPGWDFSAVEEHSRLGWEELLGRFKIDRREDKATKRMFYTALYHTFLMPSCRTGEWYPDSPGEPYYDDYFTLWDTYRTSFPLITLMDPARQGEIVQSLINIWRHDGYMPDGRSGNANGSTQGSSNADIVIADAFVKGVRGIDYEQGLQAMLKDAEVPPESDSREGRCGLEYYNTIGFLPWGVSRAGSRTVDHAFCDYAISVVARGLGRDTLADKYLRRSRNWENLWRDITDINALRGFIMARDSEGNWLDEGVVDRSGKGLPDTTLVLLPESSFNHWMNYFYESNSYEASFCMPHDIDRIIQLSGGREEFLRKLQTCVEKGYFDGGNEPSFLNTSLFHWVGRPDLTSEVCNSKILRDYNDSRQGIPGNDDSGAMSSWMAWHMAGLYPVAGFDFYLIHSPLVHSARFDLGEGKSFTIKAKGLSPKRRFVRSARLDGRDYPWSAIRHSDLTRGGTLVLKMGRRPGSWGREMLSK